MTNQQIKHGASVVSIEASKLFEITHYTIYQY